MFVLHEDTDEILEVSKLPALQGLLERMERQAGRIVANELRALVADGGYCALDEIGREQLEKICYEFHTHCTHASREKELLALQWRIQALVTNQPTAPSDVDDITAAAPCPDNSSGLDAGGEGDAATAATPCPVTVPEVGGGGQAGAGVPATSCPDQLPVLDGGGQGGAAPLPGRLPQMRVPS